MDVNFPINLSNASSTNFEDNLNGSLLGNLTICDECCQYTEEYDKNQTGKLRFFYQCSDQLSHSKNLTSLFPLDAVNYRS